MLKLALAAALIASGFYFAPVSPASACDYSWQKARDGSNCGGRAADQRRGGRNGPY